MNRVTETSYGGRDAATVKPLLRCSAATGATRGVLRTRSPGGARSRTTWPPTGSSVRSRRSAASTTAVRSGRGCTGSSPTARSTCCARSAASPTRSCPTLPDLAPVHAVGRPEPARGGGRALARAARRRRPALRGGDDAEADRGRARPSRRHRQLAARARARAAARVAGGRACRVSSSAGSRGCWPRPRSPSPGAGEEALHRALRALQPGRCSASRPPHRRSRLRGGRRPARDRRRLARRRRRAARQLRREDEARSGDPSSRCRRERTASPRSSTGGCRSSRVAASASQVPATAAALSPRALYVAAGIGDSLVAMAPDGRRAWSHPAGGQRRCDRLGAGRLPDRLRRPRRPSLRAARHLRERHPRHDDRPLGAGGEAVLAGRLARLRLRGRRREGDRLRPRARVEVVSRSEPRAVTNSRSRRRGMRSRSRGAKGVSVVECSGFPAYPRRAVGASAGSAARVGRTVPGPALGSDLRMFAPESEADRGASRPAARSRAAPGSSSCPSWAAIAAHTRLFRSRARTVSGLEVG